MSSDPWRGEPWTATDVVQTALRWTLCLLNILVWAVILTPFLVLRMRDTAFRLAQIACRLECRLGGISWTVSGAPPPPEGRYIFIANHVSMFDHFLFVGLLNQRVVGIERASHFNFPVWGWLTRGFGTIPVWREDPESGKRVREIATQRLRDGYSIVLMPEGTRTDTGRLGEFKKGAFRMAAETHTPIVAASMSGFWPIMRKGSMRVRPGHVHVHFEPPMPPPEPDRIDEAMAAVRAVWKRRLGEP